MKTLMPLKIEFTTFPERGSHAMGNVGPSGEEPGLVRRKKLRVKEKPWPEPL